jgi:hypothetical protein
MFRVFYRAAITVGELPDEAAGRAALHDLQAQKARVTPADSLIDFTGVGRPVFDMFVYSGISPTGVVITSGTDETHHRMTWSVPKLTLVSRLQALLHEGRLRILRDLADAETLVRELKDFRGEFTAAGHLTFNARTGKHDDLVLALAVAVWRAHDGGFTGWAFYELMRRQVMGAAASEPRHYVGVERAARIIRPWFESEINPPERAPAVRRGARPRSLSGRGIAPDRSGRRSNGVARMKLRRDDES